MMTEAALASFVAALFSMMNPIGNVGVFAGLTAGQSAAETRKTAWTCALSVTITLLIVTWMGPAMLKFFGITVDTLRTAGGIIVLLIGLHMLFNKSEHKHSPAEMEHSATRSSIAVVPMTIPIVGGPGTIATVLMYVEQQGGWLSQTEISVVIVALAGLTGLLFSFAPTISKWLGESGIGVVTRVMGLILSSIAVGMLAEGLKVLLPGLAG
jgi:multiple antibiotic resistance protein